MSAALSVAIGVFLGALGGAAHLAITRWRATLATTRGAGPALVAMPLGLLALGLAVFAAARVSPLSAWTTPIGIVAVRFLVLRRARR